jgi:hypothetical protein
MSGSVMKMLWLGIRSSLLALSPVFCLAQAGS